EIEFNQMSGRAGRDGRPAVVHLLYGRADSQANEAQVCGITPNREALVEVYKYLRAEQAKHGDEMFTLNLDDFEQDAAAGGRHGISAAAVKCGIAVFRELGLIEARRGCFCGDRMWAVYVKQRPEKVDLVESVRFREGLGEIAEFRSFSDWAFSARAEELLDRITHPIIPSQW
ncbi:MAG: single-stranded-DNA-specific exonuclease RecJ, partial [Eggerthellales bacterium]|nr:single-stranded-DNA-specific exonuclease RecJ [Eggerthellales bacterium]